MTFSNELLAFLACMFSISLALQSHRAFLFPFMLLVKPSIIWKLIKQAVSYPIILVTKHRITFSARHSSPFQKLIHFPWLSVLPICAAMVEGISSKIDKDKIDGHASAHSPWLPTPLWPQESQFWMLRLASVESHTFRLSRTEMSWASGGVEFNFSFLVIIN